MRAPADLGPRIAEDSRFLTCAAERVAEKMWRRTIVPDDEGRIETMVYEMQQDGGLYRTLVKQLLNSPEYRLGRNEDQNDVRSVSAGKMMTAHQLRWSIQELSGVVWTEGDLDLLDNDEFGYRVLLGGIDGRSVNQWQQAPSLTRQLTLKRFAQLAAEHAVASVLDNPDALDLFNGEDILTVSAGTPAFETIIGNWYWRMMGVEITPTELQLVQERFSMLEESVGIEEAWVRALSVTLRSSHTWIY